MKLDRTDLSIASLLGLMQTQEPEVIRVNHLVIAEDDWALTSQLGLERLPSVTAQFSGFVEVELFMDISHRHVVHLCVRQAAMTFTELHENGEVLPTLTLNCRVLSDAEKVELDAFACRYIEEGKASDRSRGEELLSLYASKALFCSKKYGELRHA